MGWGYRRALSIGCAAALVGASCQQQAAPPVPPARSAVDGDGGAETAAPAPADRDHDGIPDSADRCPDAPEDCDGFEDTDGCPDDDNDRDGMPDWCDRCPDIAARTHNGCPIVHLEVQTIRIELRVTFAVNDAKPVFGPGPGTLDDIVSVCKQTRVKRIGLVGHALASETMAAELARRRVNVVKKMLVERGVPADKFELRTAPVGNLDSCPAPEDGGAPPLCVSFAAIELDDKRLTWDGTRYVDNTPPSPAPAPAPAPLPPIDCTMPASRSVGRPCTP